MQIMIYLIDDDDIQNLINTKIIELVDDEIQTMAFEGGERALDYLKNNELDLPKLILLDINMPRMNGWEFVEKYEALGLDIPVYIVTSSINKQDQEKSASYKTIKGFISKPLTRDSVSEIFGRIFSSQ